MSKRNHIVERASDVNGGQYVQTNHSYNSGYEDGKKAGKEYCASVIESLREQVEKLTMERDTEIARNRPLQSLIKSTEETKSFLLKKSEENKEAVKQLDSERQANALLTEELAALAEQNEKQRKALLSANDFIFTLQQDLHSERCTDWYPEGAHNAATSMSESMRLIGNSCADFTNVVEALSLPDLATPVLNQLRAEGMRMAAEILIDPMDRAAAQKIRAQADELEKQNG